MIYLSGAHNEDLAAVARTERVGIIVQPGNRLHRQVHRYRWWAADNGCYAKGDRFDHDAWMTWLSTIGQPETCLFAVAPDVVGNAEATLERSRPLLRQIRKLGYRAAFVAQDGATPANLPWAEFDCLFIGGTTTFKLSLQAAHCASEAKRHGKHVHMGRVNSGARMREAATMGCDSVDGTFLAFRRRKKGSGSSDRGLPEVLRWLAEVKNQPNLNLSWPPN